MSFSFGVQCTRTFLAFISRRVKHVYQHITKTKLLQSPHASNKLKPLNNSSEAVDASISYQDSYTEGTSEIWHIPKTNWRKIE